MRVHLLRHGEVENPDRIRYGRLPGFRLSARGREEVQRSAEALAARIARDGRLAMIVSSPLERADESARIFQRVAGATELRHDARLVEAAEWREGLPRRLSAAPLLSRLVRPASWPSSERPLAIASRVADAVLDALSRWGARGDVVLVSHQTPIRLGRLALQRDLLRGGGHTLARLFAPAMARFPCETASVTTLSFREARLVDVAYVASPEREGLAYTPPA